MTARNSSAYATLEQVNALAQTLTKSIEAIRDALNIHADSLIQLNDQVKELPITVGRPLESEIKVLRGEVEELQKSIQSLMPVPPASPEELPS